MIRWKTLPWVLGVAGLAISLVAANRLIAQHETKPDGGGGGAAKPNAPTGLTIDGVVDSDPTVLRIDPPGIVGLPALTIKKVLVKEGDFVKPGDVLVQFDDAQFKQKEAAALKELEVAQAKVLTAKLQVKDFPKKTEQQRLAVDAAQKRFEGAKRAFEVAVANFNKVLDEKAFALTESQKEEKRRNNPELVTADSLVEQLEKLLKKEQLDLERLSTVVVDAKTGKSYNAADLDVLAAEAAVEAVRAKVAEAKSLNDAFKLKAEVPGEIENLMATDGMTFSPTSRTSMMYLVPSGTRVVRAEVEAEFASRVNAWEGKAVTVCDAYNFANTYAGIVRRVSSAFLPKRFGSDSLVGGSGRVLECTVDVPDPKPSGKPPLRPGQQVRVIFGK